LETAFVSIICVALMIIGGMTMSQGFLRSIDNTSANIGEISERDQNIMRTNISILTASQSANNTLEVQLKNIGQTKLAAYEKWDIIVHVTDAGGISQVTWLPYDANGLNNNEWQLKGIYINAATRTPEVFDPGLLNPDEEMVIDCQLDPPVGPNTINLVSISTPNGITISKTFTGFQPE
jgi:hypothetical protein